MRWYEAILAVALAMWVYERLRGGREHGPPRDDAAEPGASYARNTLCVHERAVEVAPEDADAHLGLAQALHELGRDDEALESVDRAISLDGSDAGSHVHRGRILGALGRRPESLEAFRRAAEMDPAMAKLAPQP